MFTGFSSALVGNMDECAGYLGQFHCKDRLLNSSYYYPRRFTELTTWEGGKRKWDEIRILWSRDPFNFFFEADFYVLVQDEHVIYAEYTQTT